MSSHFSFCDLCAWPEELSPTLDGFLEAIRLGCTHTPRSEDGGKSRAEGTCPGWGQKDALQRDDPTQSTSPVQGAHQQHKGDRVWETCTPATLPGARPGTAELHDACCQSGSLGPCLTWWVEGAPCRAPPVWCDPGAVCAVGGECAYVWAGPARMERGENAVSDGLGTTHTFILQTVVGSRAT